jgi:hypothetical protein
MSNTATRLVKNIGQLPTDCLQATPKEKPRYLFDSGVSLYSLVGRTRFELVTNGLKVHKKYCLPMLRCVDRIYANQQLADTKWRCTVVLNISKFAVFAYRLPTSIPKRHEGN